jgi:hypothetical protein
MQCPIRGREGDRRGPAAAQSLAGILVNGGSTMHIKIDCGDASLALAAPLLGFGAGPSR